MKKNKKSVPTEKKFWIISIAVGICLVVLSVCFFSNVDKEKKEADLLDTVNYVKVQCSTYTHYNESSESKSLLRAIEGSRQVSKNIAAEIENEKTLDNQLLKESAEQLWLTGIAILDIDGNIVCEYSTNESLLPEIKECAEKEIVLDTAIYDEKVYAKRINHNDGAYIDMAACTRKDAPGVVVTYYYTSAEYATNYTLTIQRLLNGYRKDRDGTIIVADEGVIIASNNTGLIGQSTTDYEAYDGLNDQWSPVSRCYAEAERPLHLCLRSGFDHISDTSAKCDHVSVHLSDCCSTNLDDLQKITEKYSQNRKGKRTEVSKEPSGSSGKG